MNLFQENPRKYTSIENIKIQQNEVKYGGNLMKITNTRLYADNLTVFGNNV